MKKRIQQMIQIAGLILLSFSPTHSAFGQLFVGEQAALHVLENGILTINGDLEIETDAFFLLNGQELQIQGDWIQNGQFFNPNGTIKFTGNNTQQVSGLFTGPQILGDVVIDQADANGIVELLNDVEIGNSLNFVTGKIKTNANEIYIKNTAVDAIEGHFNPNLQDGTYASDDRFVDGNLSRDIDPAVSTTYFFPIGNSTDLYNPLQLENQSGGATKLTANYSTQALGPINFSTVIDCSVANPVYSGSASSIVQSNALNFEADYLAMTGEGFWELNSMTNLDYDLLVYPNSANTDVSPPNTGHYRLLKRPSDDDVSTSWTPFGNMGNICVMSSNYHEIIGNGFSGFSKFGIVGLDDAALTVEWLQFTASAKDNQQIHLQWETASETNNLGFEIQRLASSSNDPSTETAWQRLGFVEGQGNSSIENAYSFLDLRPFPGENYYRLRQVDTDGQVNFSEVISATIHLEDLRVSPLFPNPVAEEMVVDVQLIHSGQVFLKIIDLMGRNLWQKNIELTKGIHRLAIDVPPLLNGQYHLYVFINQQVHTQAFTVLR